MITSNKKYSNYNLQSDKTVNMNRIDQVWTKSSLLLVLLFCVTIPLFVVLPANASKTNNANKQVVDINDDRNNHNNDYASRKFNDLLQNQKRRVRRQLQTALQLQLAAALAQNPGLAQQLQKNPELLSNLRKKLSDVYNLHQQQQRQQE